jgi:hypothetical protein
MAGFLADIDKLVPELVAAPGFIFCSCEEAYEHWSEYLHNPKITESQKIIISTLVFIGIAVDR